MSRRTMFPLLNDILNEQKISARFFHTTVAHPYIIFRHIHPDHPNGLYSQEVASCSPQIAAESNRDLAKRIFKALKTYLTEAVKDFDPVMKKNTRTIVSLASPEGCWQAPKPIEDDLFEGEILKPLQSLCADLPSWLHFNLGSLGVEVISIPHERFPQILPNPSRVITKPSSSSLPQFLDLNVEYGVQRRRMMNVALYGECGKGRVDYYTKRGLFHADPHIYQYEQVVALNKPSIILFELEQQSFAKQLIICGDFNADKQRKEFEQFFALNPSMMLSSLSGYTDISSAGMSVRKNLPSFTTISVNDFSPYFSSVSQITQKKFAGIVPRTTLDKTPCVETQYSAQLIRHWPISGKVKTYEKVQFGNITDAVKKIKVTTQPTNIATPK